MTEYDSFDQFVKAEKPHQESMHFFSRFSDKPYFGANFTENNYLIFGSETKGLSKNLFEKYPNQFVTLPMYSEHIRSLNLSNAVTAAAYEALRQIKF